MKCIKCPKTTYYGQFCKKCFCSLIEKRIKRTIRLEKLIKKNDSLVIKEPICEHFVRLAIKNMPVDIKRSGRGKKVLLWTMDDEIEQFLKSMLKDKEPKNLGHGKDIKLFLGVKEDELEAYAKAKKLEYKKRKPTRISRLLDEIEKKHKETKYSLIRSIEEISKIAG